MADLLVSDVRFHSACPADREGGLLGWVNFIFNGIVRVDGVRVSRASDGRTMLTFSADEGEASEHHVYVQPLTAAMRDAIESQVIAEVRRRGYLQ